MVGGGLAREAAKQPIIHTKRLRAKVKILGELKPLYSPAGSAALAPVTTTFQGSSFPPPEVT